MFVPLSHAPWHAQCDFGEALVVIGGVEQKAHCFVLDLPHSDGCFVKAYPAETTEAFLDGHVSAFAFLDEVPQSILYDNTRLAAAKILGDGRRQRTRAFTELQSHYLFIDVVRRLPYPALRLLDGVAEAVVEALAVELSLAGVVTPDQVPSAELLRPGIPASGVPRRSPASAPTAPPPSSPAPGRRWPASSHPQAFSAAFRTLPRASISSASAWSSLASWNIASTRAVLVVMASPVENRQIRGFMSIKAGVHDPPKTARSAWPGAGGMALGAKLRQLIPDFGRAIPVPGSCSRSFSSFSPDYAQGRCRLHYCGRPSVHDRGGMPAPGLPARRPDRP